MSEEVRAAAADRDHVARLQEQLNHWRLSAQDAATALYAAERERDDAQAALRALEGRIATDADIIKAYLIEMRRYFISHTCLTGECVAWAKLKAMFGVGSRDEDDEAWMAARSGQPFSLRRSADERKRRRGE